MIIGELKRLRDKYSASEWSSNTVAVDLVGYMDEYIEAYRDNPDVMYPS